MATGWARLFFILGLFLCPPAARAAGDPPTTGQLPSCANHLKELAGMGAATLQPWRIQYFSRRRLMNDIIQKVEGELGPVHEHTREEVELAVARHFSEYERKLGETTPLKAYLAFLGSAGASVGLWALKFFEIVPKEAHGLVDLLILNYGIRMAASAGAIIWQKIDSFFYNWSLRRPSLTNRPPDPAIAGDLLRIAQVTPGLIPPFLDGPLGKYNGVIHTVDLGLQGAALIGEVIGDRDDAARRVAEYVRIYIQHYPMFQPHERLLTEGFRTLLSRLGANRHFRNRVYDILVHERELNLDPLRVRLVLNEWIPERPGEPDRGLGPTAQTTLTLIHTNLHSAGLLGGELNRRDRAQRLVAQSALMYLQYYDQFAQYEPILSHNWDLVLEDLNQPDFRRAVREQVDRIAASQNLRVRGEEVDALLERWLPGTPPGA